MRFHLNFAINKIVSSIQPEDKIMLMGSCFAENIGVKLQESKFNIATNPHGILYNPASIAKSLNQYLSGELYTEKHLFNHGGLWHSWEHHSRFSNPDKENCLKAINDQISFAHHYIHNCDWLIITLGSSFAYKHNEKDCIVGNCHKVAADSFEKILLTSEESEKILSDAFSAIRKVNPKLKIILTVSPVRYIRDGVVENNLSKALLIQAVHQLKNKMENIFYFPAYELVIDDLRDYRFYKDDLVHPTEQAVDYVWEKFSDACFSETTKDVLEKIKKIISAKKHKPFNAESAEHLHFKRKMREETEKLQKNFPFMDLNEEIAFFS
jgi:hypothetical protein